MPWLLLSAFAIGAFLASFLCVVAERLPQGLSLGGRSFCPHCRHKLRWQDLLPVVSFLLLRGKCRYCAKPISLKHPLGEIALGAIFAVALWQTSVEHEIFTLPWIGQLVLLWNASGALFAIFFSDLEFFIIPDAVLLPTAILAGLIRIGEDLFPQTAFSPVLRVETLPFVFSSHTISSLLAGLAVLLFFAALVVVSQGRWMGLGDVKMVGYLGLVLGWPAVFPAVFLAFFLGAIFGLLLIALRKTSMQGVLPFGTFLSLAALPFLIFGEELTRFLLVSFLGFSSNIFL